MDANANANADASAGQATSRKNKLSALAVRVLHNPVRLRVLLTLLIFGGWYLGFSQPMSAGIDESTRNTSRERKRLELAKEIEQLRAQVDRFQGRLPRKTDPNEWVQFMLAGVRGFTLKLVTLDTDSTRDVGPYKAMVMKLEIEGGFQEIDRFLRWLESNPRLLRVDSIRLEPARGSRSARGTMYAKLVVLGVMG
jgi:Tfp pilus assembly protein PilO